MSEIKRGDFVLRLSDSKVFRVIDINYDSHGLGISTLTVRDSFLETILLEPNEIQKI